jgi:hypothetical protein
MAKETRVIAKNNAKVSLSGSKSLWFVRRTL